MQHLTSEIMIDAPADRVWDVLTDFDAYPHWNPFITRIEGEPVVGSRLDADLKPEGKKATRLRPTVTEAESGRVLEWLGHLGVRGIFDGQHRFELSSHDDGTTRFVQSETFTGLLARPIMAMIREATQQGFHAMNDALKSRVETHN